MKVQNSSLKLKYESDRSFKEQLEIWFIKDHKKGKITIGLQIKKIIKLYNHFKAIKFRIFNLVLKITACLLYFVEVIMDPLPKNKDEYLLKK